MNELFAADPAVCGGASELKLLLGGFGPYAGRYLANYPIDWPAQVTQLCDDVGEIEAARIQTLLRRARDTLALVPGSNLPWNPQEKWIENANRLLDISPKIFHGLVAQNAVPPTIHELHDFDLPPTAEERITGIPAEYARISKILLLLSPEIALVDPYLNPLKRSMFGVLQELFSVAANGKTQKLTLWARASLVFSSGTSSVIKNDLETKLRQLALGAKFKPRREIEMILVEDEDKQHKMHDRYVLSVKGGIRLGQGFQSLPNERVVDVAPIGKSTHDALLDIYFDGEHDMNIVDRVSIKT